MVLVFLFSRNFTHSTFSYYDANFNEYYAATANWSVECLWDCTWQENPYVGKTYHLANDAELILGITLAMPKVPVDLRCLSDCTDTKPPQSLSQFIDPWRCNKFTTPRSYLTCYIYYAQYSELSKYSTITDATKDFGIFVSRTYFHLAIESCLLALLEPTLYPSGNCAQLGVNLRVFNLYLHTPSLFSSLPTRLQGPATEEVVNLVGGLPAKNRNPWLCSLRTPGYRGLHRCGVTMLSGPPRAAIFVAAAHCNHICKDEKGRPVDLCCCREASSQFSCRGGDFCGQNSSLQMAAPQDLQIVCNLRSQELIPQGLGFPDAVVIDVLEVRVHPSYQFYQQGGGGDLLNEGPINGGDISVYIVDESRLKGP
jgi:hypothetical protein